MTDLDRLAADIDRLTVPEKLTLAIQFYEHDPRARRLVRGVLKRVEDQMFREELDEERARRRAESPKT